ncbi:integrase [Pseudogemmobacter sp. W21_MBD1_M6]|uniref:integrase n=1 Tax=Pseudogemmobacter sp. W21_MBD1_M6 TaxID=3240271 RepID=UPI003F99D677
MMIKPRGKTLYLYKRVPKRYEAVEDRKFVWVSMKTDSPALAESKGHAVWEQMIEGWEAKLAGDTSDAETRFEAARNLAKIRGFRYLDAAAVAKLPLEELLQRTDAVPMNNGSIDLKEAKALLGGAARPVITVSRALDLFWTLTGDKTLGKSPDQVRRWTNPFVKAVNNFVNVIGDKPIGEISGDDMLDFRQWWLERLEVEGLTPNSANKDLIHLGTVLKTVNNLKRLGLMLPLSGLSVKEAEAKQRPPFSTNWIRDKLLAPRALDGLNSEARCILLGMINTGYRPSEGAALRAAQIRLDTNVPHISIEPIGRQLKSANARRVIPLVGVSLEAFVAFPDGFSRYATNSAGLSATVNKFLRENGLMETPAHTLYSLRHSFEDRMLEAKIDERIRCDVFGHSLQRERYGKGASLQHLHEVFQALAL